MSDERSTVLVTGASGGIGQAVASRLHGSGWRVLGHRHRSAPADGPVVDWVTADLSRSDGVTDVVEATRAFVADRGLDLLVHCAGRLGAPDDDWQEALDLFALHSVALAGLTAGLRDRLRPAGGCVVYVSSSSAVHATPRQGMYGATKAAGEALVRSLGDELGPDGVRVLGVRPSLVRTAMNDAGPEIVERLTANAAIRQVARSDDVADVITLLAAPQTMWLTGRTVWMDGGSTLGWSR